MRCSVYAIGVRCKRTLLLAGLCSRGSMNGLTSGVTNQVVNGSGTVDGQEHYFVDAEDEVVNVSVARMPSRELTESMQEISCETTDEHVNGFDDGLFLVGDLELEVKEEPVEVEHAVAGSAQTSFRKHIDERELVFLLVVRDSDSVVLIASVSVIKEQLVQIQQQSMKRPASDKERKTDVLEFDVPLKNGTANGIDHSVSGTNGSDMNVITCPLRISADLSKQDDSCDTSSIGTVETEASQSSASRSRWPKGHKRRKVAGKRRTKCPFTLTCHFKEVDNQPIFGVAFNPHLQASGHYVFATASSNRISFYECTQDGSVNLLQGN